MMIIDNKFEIGDTVYLVTDPNQEKRIVFKFLVYRTEIVYCIVFGIEISEHYDFELSSEKNLIDV